MEIERTVEVPAAIYEWKANEADRDKAAAVQTANREALESAFAEGLSVIGYDRDAKGTGRFLLGRWDEDLVF